MFRYDSLGFLRNACDSAGSQCQNTVNSGTSGDAWSYDSTGNRTQMTWTDTYGAGNRIQSFGTSNFSYDLAGNIVCVLTGTCPSGTGGGWKYGSDALGRLREVKDGFGTLVDSLFYDPQGRRVWKKRPSSSEYYVYEGEQVVLDVDAAGTVTVVH